MLYEVITRLGRPLPYQLADGTQAPPEANKSFRHRFLNPMTTSGISSPFELLSQTSGQVTNALLTRSPLGNPSYEYKGSRITSYNVCYTKLLRILVLVLWNPATAQDQVRAVRFETPPHVDGKVEEEVWSRATPVTAFIQREPETGAPFTQRTEVYFGFDESNLYVVITSYSIHYTKLYEGSVPGEGSFLQNEPSIDASTEYQ